MTDPGEFIFESIAQPGELQSIGLGEPLMGELTKPVQNGYPPAIVDISEEKKDGVKRFLDDWLNTLDSDVQEKWDQWAKEEEAYRALKQGEKTFPFKGAANEVMPIVAMAVDPIHARLDTGIFKQDPVFSIKALKRSYVDLTPALEKFIDFYQKHYLKLRRVASPRLLECAKLGTCVFKTEYYKEEVKTMSYDESWNVVELKRKRYKGPKVFGVSIGDFWFPPGYQHVQFCPIVAERQRTTFGNLKILEASGKLENVDELKNTGTYDRTAVEEARAVAVQHQTVRATDDIVVFECWFDYDVDGDGIPEKMVATYERDSRTLLQLRYNWYFHQRFPYTVIPYGVTNDSLYGIGITEMVKPFQDAITRFYQMASDNAYLANIRMYITKKNNGIEDVPRLYAGRVFAVDSPKEDFIPFQAGDIYPSTLAVQQNLMGMVEKRTGVSDYLTGRESPIIGSRATATSTLALIQEGTRRVEEVLENIREGFAEIIENCIYIWIQFGLSEIDELVFGDDEIGAKVKQFFATIGQENVTGAIAIDLTATDASGNRQAQQAMQLQIIQVMMQYLEKLLEAGQAALIAQQQMPVYSQMIVEVMTSARKLFSDLLHKYDIRNAEEYLPDLEQFLQGGGTGVGAGQPTGGGPAGPIGGVGIEPGLPVARAAMAGPTAPVPATPGGF